MAHATSVLLDLSPPSHPTKRVTHLTATKAPARWGGQALARCPAAHRIRCARGGQLRCYSGWSAMNKPRGSARSRLERSTGPFIGQRPNRRSPQPHQSASPSHRRCADSYAARLRRDGAPLAHRSAIRCRSRAKHAQAALAHRAAYQRCARGGPLRRCSGPGASLHHPACRAPPSSPFPTQRRVARRPGALTDDHRPGPKPGNPDCPARPRRHPAARGDPAKDQIHVEGKERNREAKKPKKDKPKVLASQFQPRKAARHRQEGQVTRAGGGGPERASRRPR
jgi:hypothetical protein